MYQAGNIFVLIIIPSIGDGKREQSYILQKGIKINKLF